MNYQHTYWNSSYSNQQQQRPVSMVHMVPPQQYYSNNFIPQVQQPVYQYYYGVPVVPQQPQFVPLPRNNRRRSMEEIAKRNMVASHRMSLQNNQPRTANTPLPHSQSFQHVPNHFPRAVSRHSIASAPGRNYPTRPLLQGYQGNALPRSPSTRSAMPRGRLSSDRSRTGDGLARRAARMASIAEEERRSSLEDEVPLAMLAKRPIPAVQKCQSVEMDSRCNSTSTNSSRPSFASRSSSGGETSVTSNCSSIQYSKFLSPPSTSTSNEPPQRRRSMAKRLFSSMHRFSKSVISPAK